MGIKMHITQPNTSGLTLYDRALILGTAIMAGPQWRVILDGSILRLFFSEAEKPGVTGWAQALGLRYRLEPVALDEGRILAWKFETRVNDADAGADEDGTDVDCVDRPSNSGDSGRGAAGDSGSD